jgi:GNAT superfamily N-acetyltransferase
MPNMMPDVSIRYATIDDAALLGEMGKTTFNDAFGADNDPEHLKVYLETAFSVEQQTKELIDAANRFIIAEVDGEPAGYTKLSTGPAPDCITGANPLEVARLYSHQKWLGKGVGAALMEACIREAQQHGNDVLWLGTWDRNARGIAFYKKWGFTIVGTHIFMVGDDPQTDYLLQRPVELK